MVRGLSTPAPASGCLLRSEYKAPMDTATSTWMMHRCEFSRCSVMNVYRLRHRGPASGWSCSPCIVIEPGNCCSHTDLFRWLSGRHWYEFCVRGRHRINDVCEAPRLHTKKSHGFLVQFGTIRCSRMCQITVKRHDNGWLNPFAAFKKPVTVEYVLNSPTIADPITLLSCCPNSDGGAAAVLCSEDWMRKLGVKPIRIAASVLRTGEYQNQRDFTRWEMEETAAQFAYDQAGIGPENLLLVEVHHAFTISVIIPYEHLVVCA